MDLASGQVFQKFILEINTQNKDEYGNTDNMCSVMWTLGQGDIDPASGQAFQKFSIDKLQPNEVIEEQLRETSSRL